MTELISIDEADDPRVADYAAVRERDLVGRRGRFIAEGEVVLRMLLAQARHGVESVLVSERRADAVAPLLAGVPEGVPVYRASQAVMDRLVGFPIHRGVLAVGRRADASTPRTLLAELPGRAIVVGLIGLANHDNMGGLFRNAAAFGVGAALVDGASCDPLYRKAIRVSVGASLLVPFARGSAAEISESLLEAGFELLALSPWGETPLANLTVAPRTALLFGAEGPGLPAAILARARTVRIPMASGFDSLNVATASGIALHHIASRHPAQG